MEFREECVEDFKTLFDHYKSNIRNSEGCSYLELWQDINNPCVFMTYSFWEAEENLNSYRQSELFGIVWPKTKAMFSAKPEAWSVKVLHQLN